MCNDYMRNHTHKVIGYDVVPHKNYIKYGLSLYWTSSNYSYSKGREVMNLIILLILLKILKS